MKRARLLVQKLHRHRPAGERSSEAMHQEEGRITLVKSLHQDRGGAVFIWFTLMIGLLLGFVGLALEGARLLNLNSQMQAMADAAAVAGAKDLDRTKGARDRATASAAAVASASSNTPFWSDITGGTTITTTFYSALKSTDPANPINADVLATSDKDANYIRVETESRGITVSLLKAVGASDSAYTSATATAGVDYITCRPLQSFFCSPFEEGNTTHSIPPEPRPGSASNFVKYAKPGQMFALVSGAGAPGNWGTIDPGSRKGGRGTVLNDFWAAANQDQCTQGEPGQVGVMTGSTAKFALQGVNVRFDSPISSGDGSLSAPVVITGTVADGSAFNCIHYWNGKTATTGPASGRTNAVWPTGFDPTNYSATCNASTSSGNSCPLPRDRVFEPVFSNGAWSTGLVWGQGSNTDDLQAYWKNHHGSAPFPTIPANTAPRWYIYQQETGASPPPWTSAGVEQHEPGISPKACLKSTKGSAQRRIIDVAVVDCNYWDIKGGSKDLPPVLVNAQFFVTEPAFLTGSGGNILNIMGELVSTTEANSGSGAVHQIVTLVR